jgi:medium-chain acyl-[acyl-carrier-protein] hydrolase
MNTAMPSSNAASGRLAGPWLVRPRPAPQARVRLFCFPYAGVGPSMYRPWLDVLSPHIEAHLVQLPAREARWREPAMTVVGEIAAGVAASLGAEFDRPFAFYGHSLGALVAFEVTRLLRAAGAPMPEHLFVAAHRAPHLPNPHPHMRHLGDEEFVAELRRRYDGIPQAVLDNPELLELMLPCLRADFHAYETYQYAHQPLLSCPVSAFGGDADAYVTLDEVAGWRDQTTNSFRMRVVPGNHFFVQTERLKIIRAIEEDLRPVTAGSSRMES